MNIGEPKHVREIEPIDVPVPETVPIEEPVEDPVPEEAPAIDMTVREWPADRDDPAVLLFTRRRRVRRRGVVTVGCGRVVQSDGELRHGATGGRHADRRR